MAQDDRILLDQWAKLGDGGAFRTLVSRYSGVVYAACRRILGNPSDAEDIAQECFEALAAAGTKPGAYVGAWLHRVATYHAIGHVRSEVRRKKRESQYSSARPPQGTIEWKDIYEYVDEAVNDLPDKLRLPLIAHYLEGQSKESVGLSLGTSRQLADYRIEQGLKRVRRALQRKGVYVGVALMAGLMEANAAEAAPAAFVAKLGKITLAGPGTSAPVAALAAMKAASCMTVGGAALKIVVGACVAGVVIALGLLFGWKEIRRPYHTQDITAKSTFSMQETVPVEKRVSSTAGKGEKGGEQMPKAEAPAPVVQTLEPGTVIYGIVLDENRRPVPGATVRLDNQEQVERFALDEKQGDVGFFTSTASYARGVGCMSA
jgi:RNA polymerase sigma factor (sigma-70 family)